MADVHGEVAFVLGALVDHGQPLLAAGDAGHGVTPIELVGGVIGERAAGSARREHAVRRHVLAGLEHGAPVEVGDPVEGAGLEALERRGGENP